MLNWACVIFFLLLTTSISPSVVQMKLLVFSIIFAFLRGSSQNPKSHWTLLPNSTYNLCQNTLHRVQIIIHRALLNSMCVCVFFVSSGCGGEWLCGSAAPELFVRGRADEKRQQNGGYFLEEERSGGASKREHIPCAAGGKLRRW